MAGSISAIVVGMALLAGIGVVAAVPLTTLIAAALTVPGRPAADDAAA